MEHRREDVRDVPELLGDDERDRVESDVRGIEKIVHEEHVEPVIEDVEKARRVLLDAEPERSLDDRRVPSESELHAAPHEEHGAEPRDDVRNQEDGDGRSEQTRRNEHRAEDEEHEVRAGLQSLDDVEIAEIVLRPEEHLKVVQETGERHGEERDDDRPERHRRDEPRHENARERERDRERADPDRDGEAQQVARELRDGRFLPPDSAPINFFQKHGPRSSPATCSEPLAFPTKTSSSPAWVKPNPLPTTALPPAGLATVVPKSPSGMMIIRRNRKAGNH